MKISYSVNEASDMLGIGRSKLYQLMDKGRLHYCKIDNRRVVEHAKLVESAASCRVVT